MLRQKKPIRRVVTLMDSLGDRGTMDKRKLFGLLPMSFVSGLHSKSALGRFTTRYVWDDIWGAMLASHFLADHFKKKSSSF